MRIAPIADVKAKLSQYVSDCERHGPVIITRNGKPVAVVLAPRDEEELERVVLAHSPAFKRLMARSRSSIVAGKGLSHRQFWKKARGKRR